MLLVDIHVELNDIKGILCSRKSCEYYVDSMHLNSSNYTKCHLEITASFTYTTSLLCDKL